MIVEGAKTKQKRTEDDSIPPFRDLGVVRHQASVNISLFVHSLARLSPDLLAEVQATKKKRQKTAHTDADDDDLQSVRQGRRDTGEGKTV